jgi:peptide/nickel transport system permease protein
MMALIVFGWTGYARLVRSDILSVKQREYVLAARGLGANDVRIITRHVLPNSIYPVLVVASLDIGTMVLTFAALSFFGLGVPDGYADWGQMIASARNRIPTLDQDWFIVVFPGLAIVFFSLAWNLIGDTFRDLLDPRIVGRARGG